MDDKVQNHVDDAVNQIRVMYMKAVSRIEAIKPGEKLPATQLAEDLAKEYGQTGPQVYPVLKILLNNYPGVKILRGAHGGIHRPLPKKEETVTVAEVTTDGADKVTP